MLSQQKDQFWKRHKTIHLNNKLLRPEYMKLSADLIPPEVMKEYQPHNKINNSFIYIRIDGCIYGLPQAGWIAYDNLKLLLNEHGYKESIRTPGYWKHKTRNISFPLIVDDFGVKYVEKADIDYLISILQTKYEIEVDWEEQCFVAYH